MRLLISMLNLTTRQHRLLTSLIETYVRTAEPVASQALVGRAGLDVSPATVRNELAELEAAGYVTQPHTSAGRVPTERAWRAYVTELQAELAGRTPAPRNAEAERLKAAVSEAPDATISAPKALAKALAELVDEAVIVAFSPQEVYYTGLSNLFRQPEFFAVGEVLAISALVDHLDEVVAQLYPTAVNEVVVLLGRKNPLGEHCALLLTRYRTRDTEGVLAALGPLRQPYRHHLPLLAYARQLLANAA